VQSNGGLVCSVGAGPVQVYYTLLRKILIFTSHHLEMLPKGLFFLVTLIREYHLLPKGLFLEMLHQLERWTHHLCDVERLQHVFRVLIIRVVEQQNLDYIIQYL
jgi:hypothetical protein